MVVSTIRLPFGYFDLGPSFCAGSPFEPYAQVYTNAWSKIIDVVHRAQNYGIGVLLDLHALRGGANKGEHSGTNFGKADLWASEGNLEFGRRCNEFIIQQFKDYKNIFALGIANEVDRGPKVYPWYDSVQQRISKIDSNIPIVISDGWDFDPAVKYASEKNRAINAEQNPIIVDTHQFWAFSDKDRASTPQDLIKRVSEKFRSRVDPTRRPAFPALVGEYSNVMNGNSLAQSGENSKDSLLARIGKVQASTYEASTGGSFYWAYKRVCIDHGEMMMCRQDYGYSHLYQNWTDGRDWDFATQVMAGHCPPPQHFLVSFDDVGAKLDAFNSARKANSSNQSQDSVQGRARQLGIADALAFYRMRSTGQLGRVKMGADRIGFLDFWMRKRILQTKVIASDIPAWQNSFREGVRYFEQNVGL